MLRQLGTASLMTLLLISCAQQSDTSTGGNKIALVQDAKGRLFSFSCLAKSEPGILNPDCQLDFSTRGVAKNGRGFNVASTYNPSSTYYVIAPPTFGGNFCNAIWDVGTISAGSCYNTFGWAAPSQPSNIWGYDPACDPSTFFRPSWQYGFDRHCGFDYLPSSQPMPYPPYAPGGWGYGGNSGYGYHYGSGYGYGYGQPVPVAQGNLYAGTYSGTCTTHYKDATPATCSSTLVIDSSGNARIPGDSGCFSPVDLTGTLQPGSISLVGGAWAAQPQGQTLSLMLSPPGGIMSASGSGAGISDPAYTYECSYQRSY